MTQTATYRLTLCVMGLNSVPMEETKSLRSALGVHLPVSNTN